ncbi:MAG: alpha/beta hydrolase [Nitrospinota bacterium]|nr:alpha/beta hydrolase [Nitrospinota bacterium]MDH5756113.1 alpha/beta hydrolase [Nitrospinota bacterium]
MTETIFMVHGMWAGAWCFDKYIPYFRERGYDCVAVDLLHHDVDPKAPPPPELGTTGLEAYVDDLEAKIKKLPKPPIILGHSMGGLLTQKLAARGLGKAIILLTPASPAGIMALRWSVILSFREALLRWGFWRTPFLASFDTMVYSVLHQTPEEEQRLYYDRMVHESGRAIFEIGFWLLDSKKGAAVDETKVTAPMLVVGAGNDRITPASVARKVAEKYDHVSEYHEFPEMSHNVIGEPGWEQVAGYVCDWLRGKGM